MSVAACGSSTPSANLTGFGATNAAWDAAHKRVALYAGLPAYGPTVDTPQGPVPQFIQVQSQSGRIWQYIEVLPEGTSLAAAQKAARANLPSDVVVKSFVTATSCAFWNLTSAELGAVLGSPQVAVEMAYDDSSGSPYWLANNVNTLTFQAGKGQSTDVC